MSTNELTSAEELIISNASNAQKAYQEFSQEQVDHIVKIVAEKVQKHSLELAKMAVAETGMGVVEHKEMKNNIASLEIYKSIKDEKTVGIIREDFRSKIVEMAYPFGLVLAITPVTNPTSTAIFKTLISLKTQNAVIFSPHPHAVKSTIAALKICHDAAVEAGAPEGLIGWISEPTMGKTRELMRHKKVNLILATGGSGLVKAAYSSGKPAYGVGPGNVPVYIDKNANVIQAAKFIAESKAFDNSTLCSTEQAIVVHASVKRIFMNELQKHSVYVLNDFEKQKVARIISPEIGKLNAEIVGKSALAIAAMVGIHVPKETRVLVAEESGIGKKFPFSVEKLSPILGLYTAKDEDDGIEICSGLLDIGGRGHTFAIHANDNRVVKKFAKQMPVSRVIVNTYSSIGAPGGSTGLTPSLTLGCGSYGGNITGDNITAKHLINIKRIATGIKEVKIPFSKSDHHLEEFTSNRSEPLESIVNKVIQDSKASVDSELVLKLVKNVIQNYSN
nr:aldehyde dehydrogenase family protein [Psychrobacillus soli]